MSESKTLFLTKYALSNGGQIQTATQRDPSDDGPFVYLEGWAWTGFKLGRDVHVTEAEALAAAAAARDKKVKSLKKQIKALEAMNFSVVPR